MNRLPINDLLKVRPCDTKSQYLTEFDPSTGTIWGWLRPHEVPCFNRRLLEEIRAFDGALEAHGGTVQIANRRYEARYYVVGSLSPSVFSLGGDLLLFSSLIASRNRCKLTEYMKLCIDNIHARVRTYGSTTLTTIALLQGAALGGGLECALSSDVIIAEETARLGLPEILFNLFPGMGAYSLLARRVGMRRAEELMLSGKLHSAHELQVWGLVDVVAKAGDGEATVRDWIATTRKRQNGIQAILNNRQRVHPISRTELDSIGETWVEAALRLETRDLKVMRRLAHRQRAMQP